MRMKVKAIVPSSVTSSASVKIILCGNSALRALIEVFEASSVAGRSHRVTELALCSRRARADARASVPAPPVMTALPGHAKRLNARAAKERDRIGSRSGSSGAVSGL